MQDIRRKYVPPSIDESAFNCPHCGALATQFWFSVHADQLSKNRKPTVIDQEQMETLTFDHIEDPERKERYVNWAKQMVKGRPFIWKERKYRDYDLNNVTVSQCFNCDDVAIWIYNRLVWPQGGEAPLPNPDLPDDMRGDYEEASTLLHLSPRGAAALLRLVIQKLCEHLGGKGKNIDDDIASLVKKGLDVRVQQSLDVVRVIGNNAVHPGQIDISDDRATAERLFGLVNLIADIMISQPKHVKDMFNSLPESARDAIQKRDRPKTEKD